MTRSRGGRSWHRSRSAGAVGLFLEIGHGFGMRCRQEFLLAGSRHISRYQTHKARVPATTHRTSSPANLYVLMTLTISSLSSDVAAALSASAAASLIDFHASSDSCDGFPRLLSLCNVVVY